MGLPLGERGGVEGAAAAAGASPADGCVAWGVGWSAGAGWGGASVEGAAAAGATGSGRGCSGRGYNVKRATTGFLRAILGVDSATR